MSVSTYLRGRPKSGNRHADVDVVGDTHALAVSSFGGVVSTKNSSIETLAADAVFTGTGDDVSRFASVSVIYKSDVAFHKTISTGMYNWWETWELKHSKSTDSSPLRNSFGWCIPTGVLRKHHLDFNVFFIPRRRLYSSLERDNPNRRWMPHRHDRRLRLT